MAPEEIKSALAEKKISQYQISKNLKVSRAAIRRVITRKSTSKRIQNAIAQAIGKPFAKVWN